MESQDDSLCAIRTFKHSEMTQGHKTVEKIMAYKLVEGTYAALLTPRLDDGKFDGESFRNQLEFLLNKGIKGVALNGATSEFTGTTPDELKTMLAIAKETLAGRAEYICCVGSATLHGAVERGELAICGGAKGLLLPMPCFFPYSQDDLNSFCTEFAKLVRLPILLYNLPQFTSGLEAATVLDLVGKNKNIVGIKDSSGSLDILRALTESGLESDRLVGNDGVLAQALREGVADGVVSGVACVLPEIMKAMFELAPGSDEFEHTAKLLDEFIAQLDNFPTPWGLKFISGSRNITPASFPLPLSASRAANGAKLVAWFESWSKGAIDTVSSYLPQTRQ
jgi:4-hydroxy-tetrahydrodipicolinate synthase